jgi:pimeloyl-ACP methyl ester carboxylesterase
VTALAQHVELLAANPPRRHSVSVLGTETVYWEYGPHDGATTLVVAHGFRGEHHGLEPVVVRLGGIRVVSPDLPGFGESEPFANREHGIPDYAAWLTAFVRELGLEGDAVVLGHSFGSIVASAAVAGGLKTPKLVLVNPIAAPALEGAGGFLSRLTQGYYWAGRVLPERLGRGLLSNWLVVRFMSITLAKTRDRALRRWIHGQHHAYFSRFATRESVSEGFTASISNDVSMFAASIEVPTLLIGADHDPIVPVAAQRRLETLFPDARLTVLEGVGHLIHYERPVEAARAIADFVAEPVA